VSASYPITSCPAEELYPPASSNTISTARNSRGENIQVPASMAYPDYKKVYLDKSLTLEQ